MDVQVLILIFLENALRRYNTQSKSTAQPVLILIFLENALRLNDLYEWETHVQAS